MDLESAKEILNAKSTNITLDKLLSNNSDIKNSPFLYLLKIAANDKNFNPKTRNKQSKTIDLNNQQEKSISLHSTNNSLCSFSNDENTKNNFISQDIDVFMKDIIDKNDDKFLTGEINLFDFLIAKYLNIEIDQIPNQNNLTLRIDLQLDDYNFLNEFGLKMKNLTELNLSCSILKNTSNIGTSFKNLIILNVENCEIEDIEGNFYIYLFF